MKLTFLSLIKKNKRYISITVLLMIITAVITFLFKKPQITLSHPPIQTLQNTSSLICEEQIVSGLSAKDTCNEMNMQGFIEAGPEELMESMRITGTDKWISKKAFDRRRIKYRTENKVISLTDERLIKELEDQESGQQFNITSENEKYIIAHLLDNKNELGTSSATLFLDKSKGLLILSSINTRIFCNESLSTYSTLYSCREH